MCVCVCVRVYIYIYIYIQINQPTRCINLSDLLLIVQIQLNMFRTTGLTTTNDTATTTFQR